MSNAEQLLEAVISGTATPAQREDLAALLENDATVRRAYANQMRLHALLEWRSGRMEARPLTEVAPPTVVVPFESPHGRPRWRSALALAAALAAVAVLGWMIWPQTVPPRAGVAGEIIFVDQVSLAGEPAPLVVGERREWRTLNLHSGVLRLRLSSGAILGAEGPATLEFRDAMHVRVRSGRVTADADAAHGFTVETDRASVVDLGTRFGVSAGARGTEVVVFEGAVELHDGSTGADGPQRLVQGEAVRVSAPGKQEAIENVSAGTEPEQWANGASGLFRSVRDNRRPNDARKFYQIVPRGLGEDSRAYVDRDHEWNGLDAGGLPEFLRGADLVRPFNDDKREVDLDITVELASPATLYLFLDKKPPPAWVERAGFTDTGAKIGLDEGPSANRAASIGKGAGVSVDRIFSVWKLEVRAAGLMHLGPPRDGPTGAKAMYGFAAKPLLGTSPR